MSSENGNLVKVDEFSENKVSMDKKSENAQAGLESHSKAVDSFTSLPTTNITVPDTILTQVNKLNISEEIMPLKSVDLVASHIENEVNTNDESKQDKDIEELKSIVDSTDDQNVSEGTSARPSTGFNSKPIDTDSSQIEVNANIEIDNNPHDKEADNAKNVTTKNKDKIGIKDINTCNKMTDNTKSTVIINRKSDSLRNLLVYDSDNSSSKDSGSEDEDAIHENDTNWNLREPKSVKSGTSDSESDSLGDSTIEDEESDEESTTDDLNEDDVMDSSDSDDSVKIINTTVANKKTPAPVPKEEDLLPPVPDLSTLSIDVQTEEFMHMGHVAAVVDKLVTVEALPGVPAYDLDSCLFIEEGNMKKPLGVIFDVLGPVTAPLYCVRFNTVKDIEDLKLEKGTKVFVAPKSEYSKYVFLSELMKMKGTDASWLNDQERPGEFEDFSDDEMEREVKRGAKRTNLKRRHGSLERHQEYERSMNQCNAINTEIRRMLDGSQPVSRGRHRRPRPAAPQPNRGSQGPSTANDPWTPIVPAFDPSVPPPGFSPQTTPRLAHSNQTNNPYACLPSVPESSSNGTSRYRLSDDDIWSPVEWLPSDQSAGSPHGPPHRPPRGRGLYSGNLPIYGLFPPGPSSNNF